MNKRNRIVLILLVGITIVGATGWAISQVPRAQTNRSQYQQLVDELQPVIEQIVGAKFPQSPELRLVTSEELLQLPEWEMKADIFWSHPKIDKDIRNLAYNTCHNLSCRACVARHVKGTNVILFTPKHTKNLAAWDSSLKNVPAVGFLKLAIVHEMALLYLETTYQLLDKKYDPKNVDELQILEAVREGRAQWITLQVARKLHLEKDFSVLAARYQKLPMPSESAKVTSICAETFRQKYLAHIRGLQFWLDLNDVPKIEQTVFRQLPQTWDMIESPKLYRKQLQELDTNVQDLMQSLEKDFPVPNWKAMHQEWTPAMVQQVADSFKMTKRAKLVLADWQAGQSLIWLNPQSPGQYLGITVVRFPSAEQARKYYGLGIDLQRERDKMLARPEGATIRLEKSKFSEMKLPGISDAIVNRKELRIGDSKQVTRTSIFLFRNKETVLELSFHGVEPQLQWVNKVAETVCAP